VPDNPAAWLFRVARNAALDVVRKEQTLRRLTEADEPPDAVAPALLGGPLEDDELRMMFLCCHPVLSRDARVALSLKLVCALSVPEIARAFLASETTVAQRLVRARRQLRESRVEFDLPSPPALAERLDAVLEVIYLLFNEGYAAHSGDDLVRLDLGREGLRLARLVANSPAISSPPAHALAALLAFQAARFPARVDGAGEMVLLEDQNRELWDPRLTALGFHHLERSASGDVITAYHVQAAIAAAHAASADAGMTPWPAILNLYDDLIAINPSPVVRLNRAVAVAKVHGPQTALCQLHSLEQEHALDDYYLFHAVKGRLLADVGDTAAAARSYSAALACRCAEPERRFLQRRFAATFAAVVPPVASGGERGN
jgi:RNA polymerase sigma-70 factor (ECF subfamily)